MLTAARSNKAVAAAALLPESRHSCCSRRRGGSSAAAAAAASIARSGGRQRRKVLRPRPLLVPSLAPSRQAAASAIASAAAAAGTTEPIETELGPLKVRPLLKEDLTAAVVVLTRAFAANGSSPPLSDVEEWLSAALDNPSSETAVLVAELVPNDKGLLAPGRAYRVAGVAAVALSAAAAAAAVGGGSEESSSSSSLSSSFPLLCNVAVDPRLRRVGVGRALVSSAEALARGEGGASGSGGSLFVVARGSEDAAAEKLYSSLGFAEVESEEKKGGGNFFSSLFGNKASAEKLMMKKL